MQFTSHSHLLLSSANWIIEFDARNKMLRFKGCSSGRLLLITYAIYSACSLTVRLSEFMSYHFGSSQNARLYRTLIKGASNWFYDGLASARNRNIECSTTTLYCTLGFTRTFTHKDNTTLWILLGLSQYSNDNNVINQRTI